MKDGGKLTPITMITAFSDYKGNLQTAFNNEISGKVWCQLNA